MARVRRTDLSGLTTHAEIAVRLLLAGFLAGVLRARLFALAVRA
jgi:hypothetical protein